MEEKTISSGPVDCDCFEETNAECHNNKLYIGTKIVKATPMTETDFYKNIKNQDISNRETYGDGYMVTYEDGYVSWSPKMVFEQCYRLLSNAEIKMARMAII